MVKDSEGWCPGVAMLECGGGLVRGGGLLTFVSSCRTAASPSGLEHGAAGNLFNSLRFLLLVEIDVSSRSLSLLSAVIALSAFK